MRWGVLVIALLLGGCDQIDNYILTVASKQKANEQLGAELKIAAAQNELKSLRSNLESIKQEISGLKASQQFQQMLIDGVDKTPAEVTDSGGYGVAKTKQGIFLVTIQKLDPYLDGYRATLNIGNPHSLTMHGGDFQISWGLPWNTKGKTFDEIKASRRSKDFSIVKDFPPGAYTAVEVALTPARPEEVKDIFVEITWNRISLRRPPSTQ